MQCDALKGDGSRCAVKFGISPESRMCWSHDPIRQEQAQRARRLGGKRAAESQKGYGLESDELPPLTTPQDAGTWLEQIGRAVATGRLGHHEGTAITRTVREWLRAFDAGAVADEVERLRQQVAELKGKKLKRLK